MSSPRGSRGNSLQSPGLSPNFKATHRPSRQMQGCVDTWLPPGRARPPAPPACLHRPLRLVSQAPPRLEMKPELRDAGSGLPGPTPGTALPTRGHLLLGSDPTARQGGGPGATRAPQKVPVPGRCEQGGPGLLPAHLASDARCRGQGPTPTFLVLGARPARGEEAPEVTRPRVGTQTRRLACVESRSCFGAPVAPPHTPHPTWLGKAPSR